jgi:hypothetical protein
MTMMKDWFILAATAQAARRYHTGYEGYGPGDAHAELIMRVVAGSQISGPTPRHAQLADLRKLGFEVLNPDPHGRIVRLAGRTFVEGFSSPWWPKRRIMRGRPEAKVGP